MEKTDTWVAKVLLLGWDGNAASRTYVSELEGLSHLGVDVHDNVLTLHSVGKSSCSFTSTHRYSMESVDRGSLIDALQAMIQTSDRIELIGTGLNIGAAYDADRQTISIFDHCSDQIDSSAQVEHICMSAQVHILRNPFVGTVRKIACGDIHCLFLGSYQCFSYGSNQYGELGIGQRTAYETSLQRISLPEDTKILDIAAGPNYSAVVTLPHGHVYTFGNGAYYKLGHGDDEDRLAPTRVVELEVGSFNMDGTTAGVHLIACGTWQTIVVAKGTNDVYGWGWNKFGSLGANPKQYSTSGVYTSTNNSMVYDAGNDSHGGLYGFTHGNVQARAGAQHCTAGRGTVLRTVEHQEEMVTLPRRIEELDVEHLLGEYCPDTMHANRAKHDTGDSHGTAMDNTVCKVTCGSRHSALLTAAGRVIVIGQLGPTLLPNLDPIAIHNHIMQSFDAPPMTVEANVSGGHKAGAGSCLSGTGSAVGCKRPFSDTENGVYAQQSHTNSSGNCRRTEKGTKICVPKITQIYQWNNADYHARVLNDSDVFPTAGTKVLDIVSSGWTLCCVSE